MRIEHQITRPVSRGTTAGTAQQSGTPSLSTQASPSKRPAQSTLKASRKTTSKSPNSSPEKDCEKKPLIGGKVFWKMFLSQASVARSMKVYASFELHATPRVLIKFSSFRIRLKNKPCQLKGQSLCNRTGIGLSSIRPLLQISRSFAAQIVAKAYVQSVKSS